MEDTSSESRIAATEPPILPVKDRRKDRLLRYQLVVERTGLSLSTIYRREREGSFPRKEQIGNRLVAWYESDIDDFVANPLHYRVT